MNDSPRHLVVDLLPGIGDAHGIHLQRARLQPCAEDNIPTPITGAGIALSLDIAKAKAISEVVERYTLDRRHDLTKECSDFAVDIRWTDQEFVFAENNAEVQIHTPHRPLASACHLTLHEAAKAASVEVSERDHLIRWCKTCHDMSETFVAELDLNSQFIPTPLREFLLPRRVRFALSWCRTPAILPSIVCLAHGRNYDSFYVTSSSSWSYEDAIEKALLDCAKMFLFEDFSSERGHPQRFDHPIDLLPQAFRGKIASELQSVSADKLDGERAFRIEYRGFRHFVPLATVLGRYVVSSAMQYPKKPSKLLRCFQ